MTLWLVGLAFQLLLIIVLLARRMWNRFPIFFTYSVFCLVTASGLYLVRAFPYAYFYGYWLGEAIGLLLGFAVIYEIFKQLLEPYNALRRVAAIFSCSAVVLLILSSCLVAYAQQSAEKNRMIAAILVGEEATRILEVGLLVSLFVFSTAFGLHWRQQAFGITLGLALFVAVELIGITMRTHSGKVASETLRLMRIIGFNTSLLVWIGYLGLPERVSKATELPQRAQLEQWNRAVMELIHQ